MQLFALVAAYEPVLCSTAASSCHSRLSMGQLADARDTLICEGERCAGAITSSVLNNCVLQSVDGSSKAISPAYIGIEIDRVGVVSGTGLVAPVDASQIGIIVYHRRPADNCIDKRFLSLSWHCGEDKTQPSVLRRTGSSFTFPGSHWTAACLFTSIFYSIRLELCGPAVFVAVDIITGTSR